MLRAARSASLGDAAVARGEPIAFGLLALFAALVVVGLPVIPGHDVPQHLAYVRLIADWQASPGRLADVYAAPDVTNVYASLYRGMALLSRLMSPDASLRVVLATYVVLLSIAVRALVRATWRAHPVTGLLGPVVALNPVVCMGLLGYAIATVPLVFGVAVGIRYRATGERWRLLALAALAFVTATCHGVAGVALPLVLLLLALAVPALPARASSRGRARSLALVASSVAGLGVSALAVGPVATRPEGLGRVLLHNVRAYGVVDGVVGTFRISFTHWLQKLEQVIASVLGPFPVAQKIEVACVAAIVLALWLRARRARGPASRADAPEPGVRVALAVFALVAILAPAALQVPDDLSLLDFRLITTATILGVAAVPPRVFAGSRTAALGLGAAALVVLGVWARQLSGTAEEVMQTVRLVARLDAGDRLLALPMRDRSAFLDERNAVLHYSAVHHTAMRGGVTSLFWGRFSARLPVGYKPDRAPPRPGDWAPWEVTDEQLDAYTHVIVRWPEPDEAEPRFFELARRIEDLRDRGRLQTVACEADCCLFRTSTDRHPPPLHASLGR